MIRHITLFRFKTSTTSEDIKDIDHGLAALPGVIPQIETYQFGGDLGILEGAWDYAVVADFEDESAFAAYSNHPRHVVVVETIVRPLISEAARIQIDLI